MLERIISGGQTGVDRGALDAALDQGFPSGGACPEDRSAEDGTIPSQYPLSPLPGAGYRERTLRNVLDADATVIICAGVPSGGTRLTLDICDRQDRAVLLIDATNTSEAEAVSRMASVENQFGVRIVNGVVPAQR